MSLPKLIGITGKARSGKDTAGKFLIDTYEYYRFAFADPLKKACAEMFGIPLNHFYDDDLKELVNPFWGISPRVMAQKLGTDCGREIFFDDIWIRRAEMELKNHKYVVITDVRFENEAEFIRSNGGVLIHIQRDGAQQVNAHKSENGVAVADTDYTVFNNWSIDKLYESIDVVLDDATK